MSENAVVLVTTTHTAGAVVRWYRSAQDADVNRVLLTASVNGVMAHGYLNEIPRAWLDAAFGAHAALMADRAADLSGMATHRRRGVSNGPLEPVPPRQQEAEHG